MLRWVAQGHRKHIEEWRVLCLSAGKVFVIGRCVKKNRGRFQESDLFSFFDESTLKNDELKTAHQDRNGTFKASDNSLINALRRVSKLDQHL